MICWIDSGGEDMGGNFLGKLEMCGEPFDEAETKSESYRW